MPLAMVVEDDEDVRALFQAALERAGFKLTTAGSVREAIRILDEKEQPPDIIFVDMNLPEFPGTKVLEHIRATPRLGKIKIVVVTANTQTTSTVDQLGADLFLVKPVNLAEMMKLAQRLVTTTDANATPSATPSVVSPDSADKPSTALPDKIVVNTPTNPLTENQQNQGTNPRL